MHDNNNIEEDMKIYHVKTPKLTQNIIIVTFLASFLIFQQLRNWNRYENRIVDNSIVN